MPNNRSSAIESLRTGIILALLILSGYDAAARNFRVNLLPNGTVFSCHTCHTSGGGTPRNPFGLAVQQRVTPNGSQPFWDASLAAMDSDGDGFTNGEELGDPDGDGTPIVGATVTNPGDPASKPQPNTAPGFTSSPVTTATVGELYSYQATGFDPEGDGFTFSKGGGPAWISVSPGGLVSGTPPVGSAGDHSISLGITDDGSPPMFSLQSYTLVVSGGNTAPQFSSTPATTASIGEPYTYQATATDAEGNSLAFSKVSGPAWLSVSISGLVSGTPPEGSAGNPTVSLQVTDNGSPVLSDTQDFTLTVSASFTGFKNLNFNLPAENAIATPDQDPDKDNLPNIVEYALKTNPRQPDLLKIPGPLRFDGTGRMQFELQVRDDDPNLTIQLEAATLLPFISPSSIAPVKTDPNNADGFETWTFTDTISNGPISARFGRFKFELPQ